MIQMSLVAVSIVLIGLQCRRLTAKAGPGLRPTITLSPEHIRAVLAQLRREHPAQQS
jgi:hypothetical protein